MLPATATVNYPPLCYDTACCCFLVFLTPRHCFQTSGVACQFLHKSSHDAQAFDEKSQRIQSHNVSVEA